MKRRLVGAILGLSASLWSMVGGNMVSNAEAVQLSDGRTFFNHPPRLVGASTTFQAAYMGSATYYFTLDVPENAGEPLQKVVIRQAEGADRPYYNLSGTEAFAGTRRRSGTKLPLQEVTVAPDRRTVTVTFDPPVAPGTTVTIGLYPIRNPAFGGVYLYGVTAFPAGTQANGQFLGYGRIHIYDSYRDGLFRGWWP